MPKKRGGYRNKTQVRSSKHSIGRYMNFIKDHWFGSIALAISTSVTASFIYTALVPSPSPEPKPPSKFCTFSSKSEGDKTEGTAYSVGYRENLKLRSDSTTVSGDKTKKVHLLVRSMIAYVWWNNENEGIRFPVGVKPFTEQLVKLASNGQLSDEPDFKCTDWKPDDSKFAFPTNVNFIDTEEKKNDPFPQNTDGRHCSASIPTMDGITHGTIYFGDGDKLRVDLLTSSDKERHIIFNSKMAYFWNAPRNTGIKFPVKGRPSDALLNPTAKVECQKWEPDNSVFVPPEYVSFKEASGEDVAWYIDDFSRP